MAEETLELDGVAYERDGDPTHRHWFAKDAGVPGRICGNCHGREFILRHGGSYDLLGRCAACGLESCVWC